MEITPSYPRILLQHETTRHSKRSPTLPPNGIQPYFRPNRLSDYKHPSNTRTTIIITRSKKRGKCCTRTSKTEDDGKNDKRIYSIQERRQGLVRIEIFETSTRKQETRPQTRGTISDHRSPQPPQLPSIITENLANSPCLPRLTLIPLQTQRYPRRKLP